VIYYSSDAGSIRFLEDKLDSCGIKFVREAWPSRAALLQELHPREPSLDPRSARHVVEVSQIPRQFNECLQKYVKNRPAVKIRKQETGAKKVWTDSRFYFRDLLEKLDRFDLDAAQEQDAEWIRLYEQLPKNEKLRKAREEALNELFWHFISKERSHLTNQEWETFKQLHGCLGEIPPPKLARRGLKLVISAGREHAHIK
jgi:hypothetical protein